MILTPHRRYNPLTREWVLVSPQRTNRPWLGQVEEQKAPEIPQYDPKCSLCPGNKRATGNQNDAYTSTFVFDNDFPALLPEEHSEITPFDHPLLKAEPASGACRVVCFSPRHDLTLPDMTLDEVQQVVATWANESGQLGSRKDIHYVQVFENKGAMMGCSNPHPHSQIWATSMIPNEPAKELAAQKDYLKDNGNPLLLDYVNVELQSGERVVASNENFTALVPFWAIWPFEVMLVARTPISSLTECSPAVQRNLAEMLLAVTKKYDRLFNVTFPYSMGFHQAPTDAEEHPEWVLHAHFYPPLLRSATIRKFMVGYELLAMPQRDITPEGAAKVLREIEI